METLIEHLQFPGGLILTHTHINQRQFINMGCFALGLVGIKTTLRGKPLNQLGLGNMGSSVPD